MKGTRPWRQTSSERAAEHRMLVDLGRNDIGRISELLVFKSQVYGSGLFICHALTSVVKGRYLPELTAMDALGTSSWNSFRAPKIPGHETDLWTGDGKTKAYTPRAIGYLSATGDGLCHCHPNYDSQKTKIAYVQAGAGLSDSIAQNEYRNH